MNAPYNKVMKRLIGWLKKENTISGFCKAYRIVMLANKMTMP